MWISPYLGISQVKFYDNLKKSKHKQALKPQKSNTTKLEKNTEASKADADKISNELKKYKQMLSDGLISQADYNAKKKKILGI